jgi:putative phage-type endonuclease
MEQRTDEWFAARLGKVTASKVSDVMSKGMGRETYMTYLIAEVLTTERASSFTNTAMEWGTATEPYARQAYEALNNLWVEEIGFAQHPTIERAGASPDGLVGDDGLIEIKCPNTATHLDTLIDKTVPKKYINQMQFQMACTGRKWCDFVSFDNRLPEDLQIFVLRVERDDKHIAEMEIAITKFLAEMQEKIDKLTKSKAANV